MKPLILVLVLLASGTFTKSTQEHAPTPDVCRADAAMWSSQDIRDDYYTANREWAERQIPDSSRLSKLRYTELELRLTEMRDCMTTDSPNIDTYSIAFNFYSTIMDNRVTKFMDRHELWEKFLAEDAAGKR